MAEVERISDAFLDYCIDNGQRRHFWDYSELELYDPRIRCILKNGRPVILTTYHYRPTAGHLEIVKSTARIALKYYWPGLFSNIEN